VMVVIEGLVMVKKELIGGYLMIWRGNEKGGFGGQIVGKVGEGMIFWLFC